jgi:starch synthase
MKVLSVVSEVYPLIKTGGLADVAGALPAALKAEGIEVMTLLPGYPAVMAALDNADASPVYWMDELFGGPATLLVADVDGLEIFVIEAKHLYDRPGGPYAGPDGDWPDNPFRFAALARVAAQIAYGEVPGFLPDVLHAHDWQAGLLPAYLRFDGRRHAPSVMTVHNLAFQGQYAPGILAALGLPPQAYAIDGVEYYGTIGFLKAGLAMADRVTTVSPTYAREICTEEGGMGLAGLLAGRGSDLVGILNGIDTEVWNPAKDGLLQQRFTVDTLAGRSANKAALQRRFGLEVNTERLLFGVVSRLTWQKGLDLLVEVLPKLTEIGAQLALIGTGDAQIQTALSTAAAANPHDIGAVFGYDEALAHQLQGGVDALLVPSRFEPCGLTQLCALRYGALPVVSRVGGLADTVLDVDIEGSAATGVQFSPVTAEQFATALQRASDLWQVPTQWKKLQENAMRTDVSWARPAAKYAALYREIAGLRPST